MEPGAILSVPLAHPAQTLPGRQFPNIPRAAAAALVNLYVYVFIVDIEGEDAFGDTRGLANILSPGKITIYRELATIPILYIALLARMVTCENI